MRAQLFGLLLASALVSGCQTLGSSRAPIPDAGPPAETADAPTVAQRALRTKVELGLRLHRVVAPMLQALAPDCPGFTVGHGGWLAVSRTSFGADTAEQTAEAFDLEGQELKVVSLVPGMPAAIEGMERGDIIAAVNGRTLGDDSQSRLIARQVLNPAGENSYDLIRGALQLRGSVTPTDICGIPLFISEQDSQNILNDGNSILVDRGLLGLMVEDRDLAALVAHEIAHLLLGTRGRAPSGLDMQALFSPILSARTAWGGLAQPVTDPLTTPFTTDQLLAADRTALILMERAGINTNGYEALWRRLAADRADVTRLRPVTRQRLAGIGVIRTDLAEQRASGAPLRLVVPPPGQ